MRRVVVTVCALVLCICVLADGPNTSALSSPSVQSLFRAKGEAIGAQTLEVKRPEPRPDPDAAVALTPAASAMSANLMRQGGEDCASAFVIPSLPFSDIGTTVGAVNDYDAVCPYANGTAPDVVYAYTPAADGVLLLTLCVGVTNYDTKMYMYENYCATGLDVACNDDACTSPAFPQGYISRIDNFPVTAGKTYYIVVDGYGAASAGTYQLDVSDVYAGACCLTSGHCLDGLTETGCQNAGGTYQGAASECATVTCTPCVECPAGAVPEGEPTCYDGYHDTFNSGCMGPQPWPFSPLVCGETICGEAGTYVLGQYNYRDTDWYQFEVTQRSVVTCTAAATFPLFFAIIYTEDCQSAQFWQALANPCETATITQELPAGTYLLWVGPSVFVGVPCGSPYTATVTCTPVDIAACCLPGFACLMRSESQCAAAGGIYLGSGTSCNTSPCQDVCVHQICLVDALDTWNGNSADVLVNGVVVLDDITLTFNQGPACFGFQANTGDPILVDYTGDAAHWHYENGWTLYDTFGEVLCHEPTGNPPPTDCTAIANCAPPPVGACCLISGHCLDSVTAADCQGTGGAYQGDGSDCAAVQCVPCVECPASATPEGEPVCSNNYVDTFNGGCNNPQPWPFSPIACGETVCGESGTFLTGTATSRDTDWYQFDLAQDALVTCTAEATFPLQIVIIETSDCVHMTMWWDTAAACETASVTQELPAGTYLLWVGPSAFTGVPCGAPYSVTLTCTPVEPGACCLPGFTCQMLLESQCVAAGGVFQGPGTSCQADACATVCVHQICLVDSTDDWNGNSVDVQVNGVVVLDNITLTTEFGPVCFGFQANTGDTILVDYTGDAAHWDYENGWTLHDVYGDLLCRELTGSPPPVDCTAIANCEPLVFGACCLLNGDCLDVTQNQCGFAGGTYHGPNTTCATTECVPCLVCPPQATPEGEPVCYENYVDTFNGGCNLPPLYPFSDITCGETVCGDAGTYLYLGYDFRDTDWYRLTVEQPALVTWTGAATFPLQLLIISGTCEELTYVAAAAPACETASVSQLLQPGQYMLWAGPSALTGTPCGSEYYATVTCEPAFAPENDDCANAACVPEGLVIGDLTLATDDGVASCQSNSHRSVWYRYRPTIGGTVAVDTCYGAEFNTVLSAYDACDGAELACNDNYCGARSLITFSATAGHEYLIRVAAWGDGVGLFGLTISGGAGVCFGVGDMNCDGQINALDINPFVKAMTNEAAYYEQYPLCDHTNGDINCDGAVNALDINPFVQCITGACPPCP